MPMLGSRYRLVTTSTPNIGYQAGQRVPLKLPNGMFQKGLLLRVTGTLEVGVAVAQVFAEAPLALIRNIHVIGDGRRHLFTIQGRDAYRLAQFARLGRATELTPPQGLVGSNTFAVTIPIDHEALMFFNPVESLFDPRRYREVTLEIEWGLATDIATAGGGGTIAIGAATTMEVQVNNTGDSGGILFDHVVSQYIQPVTATNPALEIDIPPTGLLAGILLRATRDLGAGAGPALADDLVTTLALKSDQTVYHIDPQTWTRLQRQNAAQYGTEVGGTTLRTAPGYLYVPLQEHGSFGSALNVSALNKPKLILGVVRNPAASEQVVVTWDAFEPRPEIAA